MGTVRIYEYIGKPRLTRGNYGVNIEGAHTRLDDPDFLYVLDPDFGDRIVCRVEDAEAEGFLFLHEQEVWDDPVRR